MPDSKDSRRASAEAARHDAARHIQTSASEPKPAYIPLGIGAVVLIAVAAFLLNDPNKAERALGKALESTDSRAIPSARGQRGALTLGDETAVKLGAESLVKVPPGFNAQVRGVGVLGAAQFTLKPVGEKDLTFRARARKVSVESKGGTFAMRAFDDDPEVYVMTKEGPLTLHPNTDDKDTQEVPVGPGVAVGNDGKTRALTQAESDAAFSWVDGNYTLNAVPLSAVLPVLQRWYNTSATITDKTLASRPVTAILKLDSSKDALEAISTAASVHVAFRGDTLTLVDGAPSTATAGKGKGKGK